MQKLAVVFSGAGLSAESGIQTFRDSNGLWHNQFRIDHHHAIGLCLSSALFNLLDKSYHEDIIKSIRKY
jgi:NAD-dependent SIR2 family protein deacetylase